MRKEKEISLRVMVALEDRETRAQIVEIVEREPKVKVVGQASNALEALSLARSLRPEMTVVDWQLPYYTGLDNVGLSRISGLDTANTILQELLAGKAILLSNTSSALSLEQQPDTVAALVRYTGDVGVPIELRRLAVEGETSKEVIFGDIWQQEATLPRSRVTNVTDVMFWTGGLVTAAGMVLLILIFTAVPGAVLVAVGLAIIVMAIIVRAVAAALRTVTRW